MAGELLAGMVATASFVYLAKDIIYQMVSQEIQQVKQEMANPVPAKPTAEMVNPVPVTSAEPKPPALSPKTFPIPSHEVRSWQAHQGGLEGAICSGNCLAFTPTAIKLSSNYGVGLQLWQRRLTLANLVQI